MKRIYTYIIFLSTVSAVLADQEPTVLTTKPVFRNTTQIMQGEVASPLPIKAPQASPTVVPGIPLVVQHFTVADYQETGQYGPSAESSVGSTQLLVASKGRIRSFSKTGILDNVLNLTHDSFFSPITRGGFTADPNVIFHPEWKQWIILGNAFLSSSLVLAISDGDPITPQTIWSFYIVDQVSNPGFSPTAFFDYPTLGVDSQSVYCAANIIDANDFFSSAAYVIPRSSLLSKTSSTIYAFRNLGTQNADLRPFTLQPAENFDTNSTVGYFASIDWNEALTNVANNILINRTTFGVNGIPTLSDTISVPVNSFVQPLIVNVLGTPQSHPIAPVVGFRLSPAHIRNNRLWLVANISVDNKGNSDGPPCIPPNGSITRNAARFIQIDITKLNTPGAVVSQGTLFQATPTNDLGERSFLTPAIMSNAQGKVLIAATTCGEKERLNAAVAQLINNNTDVGKPVLYTASTSNYNATEDWEFVPFARWGDHTRISPDPEDPAAFWTSQQWCSQENTWALEAAQVLTN